MDELKPECVICLDNLVDGVLLPCGHRCICSICSDNLTFLVKSTCPICRVKFTEIKKLNL
jgi:hypothetical protein